MTLTDDNPRHDPGCGGMVIPIALQEKPEWCCPTFERWASRPDAFEELIRAAAVLLAEAIGG